MPTDILIYMIVAAVMVFWLRSVIGTRHGQERDRSNPLEEKSPNTKQPNLIIDTDIVDGEKMNVDAGLVQIALADKSFDANEFKENAGDAFSFIVKAFADGDRHVLQDLCTDTVYKAFDKAIKDREKKGEKVSTEIHSIRKTDITDACVDRKKHAHVAIRFTADETYVIENNKGEIISGHPDRVTEMTDKWTFTRDLKSPDPRWFLSKTEDDVVEEDGKTPVPDAG